MELLYRGDSSRFDAPSKASLKLGDWQGEIRQFTKADGELMVEAHWTLIRDEQGGSANT